MRKHRSYLLLFIFMAVGFVIGNFVGPYIPIPQISGTWQFGISPEHPFILNMSVIRLAFGLVFEVSVAGALGLLLGAFLYKIF